MVKDFTNQEVEKRIEQVCGSFAVDGFSIDDEMKERARRVLRGDITADEAIAEITQEF